MDKKEKGAVSIVSIFLCLIIIALAAVAVYLYMDLRKLKNSNASEAIKIPETTIEEKTSTEENKTEAEVIKDRMSLLEGDESKYSSNLSTRTYAVTASLRTADGDIKLYLGTDNKLYVEADESNGNEIPGATDKNGAIYGVDLGLRDISMIYEAEFGGRNNQKSALIILREDGYFYALKNILDSNYKEEKIDVEKPVGCYIPVTGIGKTIVIDENGESTEVE